MVFGLVWPAETHWCKAELRLKSGRSLTISHSHGQGAADPKCAMAAAQGATAFDRITAIGVAV
jgi:hypothetical protein